MNQKTNTNSVFKKDIEHLGNAIKDMAGDSAEYVRDNAADYYHKGQEMIRGAEQSVEGQIKKHPMRSLFIAAGVGFLFGFLLKK